MNLTSSPVYYYTLVCFVLFYKCCFMHLTEKIRRKGKIMHFMPSQLSVCYTLTLGTHNLFNPIERERERGGGGWANV